MSPSRRRNWRPAQANLHAAEATLAITQANYRRIIGVDPANLAPASSVERFAPSTLNSAIALGTAQNPSVTAAMYGVDVALLQVKIAEGALFPTLAAQYNAQYNVFPQITVAEDVHRHGRRSISRCRSIKAAANIRRSGRIKKRSASSNSMSIRCATRRAPMSSGLGAIAGGESADRSRATPERRRRTRAQRRAQRSPGRPAHDAGRAQSPSRFW